MSKAEGAVGHALHEGEHVGGRTLGEGGRLAEGGRLTEEEIHGEKSFNNYSSEFSTTRSNSITLGTPYDENPIIVEAAKNIEPNGNFYDIVGHGNGNFLKSPEGEKWGAKDVGDFIKKQPDYNGQPVRIVACKAGCLNNGIAQKLADYMGVPVMAHTNLIKIDRQGVLSFPESGYWRIFVPGLHIH